MNFENVSDVEATCNYVADERHLEVKKTNSAMKIAGLFFFLVMIFELPLSVLLSVVQMIVPEDYTVLANILFTQGYLLICGLLYVWITRQSFAKDLKIRRYKLSSFFLSLVVLMFASPMATWFNIMSQLFAKNEISNSIYDVTQAVPMWLGIAIIGCLPGFIEELLYRGIIYNAFRKRSVLTGIVVSAFTFGLMHMNFNQIMYAVYLGVIFALVLEATGSLVSTMILHMVFNACNTANVYILPKVYEYLGRYSDAYANIDMDEMMNATLSRQDALVSLVVITPAALIGLVLAILLIRQIAKMNGREFSWKYFCGNKEEVKQTKPVNIPLILGCVFCILIAVVNL